MLREFTYREFWYLVEAARWTVLLALTTFVLGGLCGFAVAVLRVLPFAPVRYLVAGYIQLIQATPLLMKLFLLYFGINLLGLRIDAWVATVAAFTVSGSAFFGEIWRGCIQTVPKGQWEAARSLALSFPRTLWLIVL